MNKPVQLNMYISDSLAVAISLIWFTDSKLQKGFQSWRNLQAALPSRLSVPAVLQCCTLGQHHHITHAASCRIRCGGVGGGWSPALNH